MENDLFLKAKTPSKNLVDRRKLILCHNQLKIFDEITEEVYPSYLFIEVLPCPLCIFINLS